MYSDIHISTLVFNYTQMKMIYISWPKTCKMSEVLAKQDCSFSYFSQSVFYNYYLFPQVVHFYSNFANNAWHQNNPIASGMQLCVGSFQDLVSCLKQESKPIHRQLLHVGVEVCELSYFKTMTKQRN